MIDHLTNSCRCLQYCVSYFLQMWKLNSRSQMYHSNFESLLSAGTHQVVKSTLCSVFLQCNPILFLFSQVSQKWAHSWGLPRLWLPSLQEGGKGNSSSAEALFTPLSQFSYLCRGIRSSSPMTILMLLFVVILNTNVDLHQAAISF